MAAYSFVGFQKDGSSHAVELFELTEPDALQVYAERFFQQHPTAVAVEVICGGDVLMHVKRDTSDGSSERKSFQPKERSERR